MQSDLPSEVAAWREAIRHLNPVVSPCRYLNSQRWVELREAALDFIDRFGVDAHAHGWSAVGPFAVQAQHGTLRVDWCGALMVSGRKATHVDAAVIGFDGMTGYGNMPGKPKGIPVWELKGVELKLL